MARGSVCLFVCVHECVVDTCMYTQPARDIRTFLGRVGLDEALSGACFLELGRQPCELWQMLVDDAYLRGEVVVVEVLAEVSSGVA